MNFLAKLFRDTLEPTERDCQRREPTELDRAKQEIEWFQSQAEYWEARYRRERGLLTALIEIRNYVAPQKSGTARKVHRMILEALK